MRAWRIRFIKEEEKVYVHVDDMVSYLQELAEGEEADVKSRMLEAANSIKAASEKAIEN
jgi:hypothetical protein